MGSHRIVYTATAQRLIKKLPLSVRNSLPKKLETLAANPDLGKNLRGDLFPYQSAPVAGRYRVIFRVDPSFKIDDEMIPALIVFYVGIRQEGSVADVYEKFRKLLEE